MTKEIDVTSRLDFRTSEATDYRLLKDEVIVDFIQTHQY